MKIKITQNIGTSQKSLAHIFTIFYQIEVDSSREMLGKLRLISVEADITSFQGNLMNFNPLSEILEI